MASLVGEVRRRRNRLLDRMMYLGFDLRQEASLDTLTADILKSSEIEGEILDAGEVRSSIAWRLGLGLGGIPSGDRNVEGIVDLMLDATQNYAKPLSDERLFGWHAALFPTGRSGRAPITVGDGGMMPMARCRWFRGLSGKSGCITRPRTRTEWPGRCGRFSTGSMRRRVLMRC